MSWKLAPSLGHLLEEVNAKWPKRSKATDGTIGDDAHAARTSQHNPNRDSSDDVPDGYVTAMDITATDVKIRTALLELLIGDDRVWYVINRGRMWSRTNGWKANDYDGDNPHTSHIHVSLRQAKTACNSTAKWFAAEAPAPKPEPKPLPQLKPYPTLSRGESDPILVPFLKRFFGLDHINENALFGAGTELEVVKFQKRNHLAADGVVGKKTWAAIQAGGTILPKGYQL